MLPSPPPCARSTCSTAAISTRLRVACRPTSTPARTSSAPNLDAVRSEVRSELDRLGQLVAELGDVERPALRRGRRSRCAATPRSAATLSDSTRSLREALAQPAGPRSVGRAHGRGRAAPRRLHRERQLPQAGAAAQRRCRRRHRPPRLHVRPAQGPRAPHGRQVPAGRPTCATSRRAPTPSGRAPQVVPARRAHAGQGARRSATTATATSRSVDYVLLFLPNEQLTGFIHEHDPALLDDALGQRVVMCSPLTLFAFLGVIRQAFDNFMIEQTSDEILKLVGHVQRAVAQVHRVGRQGEAPLRLRLHDEFDRAHHHPRADARAPAPPDRSAPRPAIPSTTAEELDDVDVAPAAGRRRRRRQRRSAAGPVRLELSCRSQSSISRSGRRRRSRATCSPRARTRSASSPTLIRNRLRAGFDDGVWVRGEIQGWSARGRPRLLHARRRPVGVQGGDPGRLLRPAARPAAPPARSATTSCSATG